MKVLLLMIMLGVCEGMLPAPNATYNILMLLPVSSKSHRAMFMTLACSLADRGHKVVMITNHPASSNHPNITEIHHGLIHYNPQQLDMFTVRNQDEFSFRKQLLSKMARDFYNVPSVREIYKKRKEFDVVIVNIGQCEVAYPFTYQLPFIGVTPVGLSSESSAVLGNVLNPAYAIHQFSYSPTSQSLWHRVNNLIATIRWAFYWRVWTVVPAVQEQITAQFPDLPPLLELEKNMSIIFTNTHFSLNMPVPLLPSQVEVGAMHCRQPNPLPQDVERWISGAGSKGVIYFSLGSLCLGTSMPHQYRNMFIEAFSRLPQRVLWKYEGQLQASHNVITKSWLPQQDILGHDNVKVFISHGGLFSVQESVYHKTPLLILPILSDQTRNGIFVNNSGMGRIIIWEELTTDAIVDAINDLVTNPRYHERVSKVSELVKDQMTTAKDRAVFWTEFVIRHGGVPELKSPASDLSWPQFLMLDMLIILLAIIIISGYCLLKITKAFLVNTVTFRG